MFTPSSSHDLLSIEQVAHQLGLHVRTVRRYVRHGRLPAARIGKQYRIARAAVDALTGATTPAPPAVVAPDGGRQVEVSSIVLVDGIDQDGAGRVTTALLAAVNGRPVESDPVRIDTIYAPSHQRLKVILTGSLGTTASLLKFVNAYLQS